MTDQPIDLKIGSIAPDFSLPSNLGREIKLSDFKSQANVVLFFVREYNWIQCRSHAAQLGRLYPDFKSKNVEILVILGDSPEKAAQYAQILHLSFPVLADPERSVYHRYGLDKVLLFIQRTASLVIDQKGIIRYIKSTANTLTWLEENRELMGFVQTISNNGWDQKFSVTNQKWLVSIK